MFAQKSAKAAETATHVFPKNDFAFFATFAFIVDTDMRMVDEHV
jgi:hypothetical protein